MRALQEDEARLGPARRRVRRPRDGLHRRRRLHRKYPPHPAPLVSYFRCLPSLFLCLCLNTPRKTLADLRHSLALTLTAGLMPQVERDLCTSAGVRGYPTIKYWKAGQPDTGNSSFLIQKSIIFLRWAA